MGLKPHSLAQLEEIDWVRLTLLSSEVEVVSEWWMTFTFRVMLNRLQWILTEIPFVFVSYDYDGTYPLKLKDWYAP